MKSETTTLADKHDRTKSSGLPDIRALRTYDRTKDISYHPYFRGGISRWVWRVYMYRVTAPGHWFMGLTFFLVLYGTTSIDLQIFIPLLYAFGVWFVAWLTAMLLPPNVQLNYTVPDRVGAASEVAVAVDVISRSRWPLAELVVVPMRLHPMVDSRPTDGIPILQLNPSAHETVQFVFVFHKRGLYNLKGFRVETGFPIGILRAYRALWKSDKVLVYPTFRSLSHITLPAGKRYQPGGVALASRLGDSMEYIGNREYRDGDNLRDIDWRATARLMRPIVKEYREEYFYRVGVIQDTFVSRGSPEREQDFERSISISAAVSDYMARAEYVVDLFAAGPNLYHLTAGRSLAFQDQILDILACLEPANEEPFQIIEPELLACLGQLTTVICIMLDWDDTRRAFVDRVREVSDVKVIIVRDAACTLDPSMFVAELALTHIRRLDYDQGLGSL